MINNQSIISTPLTLSAKLSLLGLTLCGPDTPQYPHHIQQRLGQIKLVNSFEEHKGIKINRATTSYKAIYSFYTAFLMNLEQT